jgi:hypothetical protein
VPQAAVDGPPFLDVNDDGLVTTSDALAVINHLNAFGPTPGVVGEGESRGALVTSLRATADLDADWLALIAQDVASRGKGKRAGF